MYNRLGSNQNLATDSGQVEAHTGDLRDFKRRFANAAARIRQASAADQRQFQEKLIRRVADTRNLRLAWNYLASHGGEAAGPDEQTYADFDRDAVWDLLRGIRQKLLAGSYSPGPERPQPISKGPGRGLRTLCIQNIQDRVVQRAIVQILQPLVDPRFDPRSFGSRPKKGHLHALALAQAIARAEDRFLWVAEDVRDAFDNVPLNRLLDPVRTFVPNDDFLGLVRCVIANPTMTGLRQGGSLSPLLLNIYLHHFLDRVWRQRHPGIPLIRVVDDILLLCRDWGEAAVAYRDLQRLLGDAALSLKGNVNSSLFDLETGDAVNWLGFRVTQFQGRFRYGLPDKAFGQLAENLALAHTKPDSPLRAIDAIHGWVDQIGPAFPSSSGGMDQAYSHIHTLAAAEAFDEIPHQAALMERWRKSHRRWQVLVKRTQAQVDATGRS